jgi:hypothetical protein
MRAASVGMTVVGLGWDAEKFKSKTQVHEPTANLGHPSWVVDIPRSVLGFRGHAQLDGKQLNERNPRGPKLILSNRRNCASARQVLKLTSEHSFGEDSLYENS